MFLTSYGLHIIIQTKQQLVGHESTTANGKDNVDEKEEPGGVALRFSLLHRPCAEDSRSLVKIGPGTYDKRRINMSVNFRQRRASVAVIPQGQVVRGFIFSGGQQTASARTVRIRTKKPAVIVETKHVLINSRRRKTIR